MDHTFLLISTIPGNVGDSFYDLMSVNQFKNQTLYGLFEKTVYCFHFEKNLLTARS